MHDCFPIENFNASTLSAKIEPYACCFISEHICLATWLMIEFEVRFEVSTVVANDCNSFVQVASMPFSEMVYLCCVRPSSCWIWYCSCICVEATICERTVLICYSTYIESLSTKYHNRNALQPSSVLTITHCNWWRLLQ